jgi:hypothetical protein
LSEAFLKRITAVALVLIGIVMPHDASAACGHEGVSVSGTVEEVDDACRALGEVLNYFARIGARPVPQVRISFQDQVYIDMYLHTYDPASKQPVGENEVSGCYNFARRELQVTSGRRDIKRERRPWNIEWSQPIAYSILEHELVHAVLANLLDGSYQRLAKAWHEFIAYSVQIDLMDRELRNKVLANYPDATPFQFPESVNPIVYAADPDEFGVSAYLMAEASGGSEFIRQLLTKGVPFSTEEFEFLWSCTR